MYNFNLKRLVLFLLPASLRGNIADFIKTLCSPFINLHTEFTIFSNNQLKALTYNSQYPHLQRLLNDKFDNTLRRIKVHDIPHPEPIIIYPLEEAKIIKILQPLLVHNNVRYTYPGFHVECPQYFHYDVVNQIKKTVRLYKFKGIKDDLGSTNIFYVNNSN